VTDELDLLREKFPHRSDRHRAFSTRARVALHDLSMSDMAATVKAARLHGLDSKTAAGVLRNGSEVDRKVLLGEMVPLDELAAESPAFRGWLEADIDRAAVAASDVEGLTELVLAMRRQQHRQQGLMEESGESFTLGMLNMRGSLAAMTLAAARDDEGRAEASSALADYSRSAHQLRADRSDSLQRYFAGLDDAEGMELVAQALSTPSGFINLIVENLGFSLPALGASAAMLPLGPLGVAGGAFLGGTTTEAGAYIMGELSQYADMADAQSIYEASRNRTRMARLSDEGLRKGAVIGALDAVTGLAGGKLGGIIAKRSRWAAAASQQLVEAIGEGGGEFLGQMAATGEGDFDEALLESLASMGTAGGQAALNRAAMTSRAAVGVPARKVRRAIDAHVNARNTRDLIERWRASKTAKALPEDTAELLEKHLGSMTDASVAVFDKDAWDAFAEENDLDPVELLDSFTRGNGEMAYGLADDSGTIAVRFSDFIDTMAQREELVDLVDLGEFHDTAMSASEAGLVSLDETEEGGLTGLEAEESELREELASLDDPAAEAALQADLAGVLEDNDESSQPVIMDPRLTSALRDILRGDVSSGIPELRGILAGTGVREFSPGDDSQVQEEMQGILEGEQRNSPLRPADPALAEELREILEGVKTPASGGLDQLQRELAGTAAPRDAGGAGARRLQENLRQLLDDAQYEDTELLQRDLRGILEGTLQQGDARRTEIEGRLAQIDETYKAAQDLENALTAQLVATGRSPEDARLSAFLMAAGFKAMAARSGLSEATLLDRFRVRVGGAPIEGDGVSQEATRGETTLFRDTDGRRSFQIEMLAGRNLSTFLHETGHVFLEMLGDLAAEGGDAQQQRDFAAVIEWLGMTPEEWRATDIEGRRAGHERFARAFEAYLMEGDAPSLALRRAFSRFTDWLVAIYSDLVGLEARAGFEVGLTDEVRGVMDRLLATDQELQEVRGEMGHLDVPHGTSDTDEIVGFEQAQEDADRVDRERLLAEKRREAKADASAERSRRFSEVLGEVLATLNEQPAVRAYHAIVDGMEAGGQKLTHAPKIDPESVPKEILPELRRIGALAEDGDPSEPLDALAQAWGAHGTRQFVAQLVAASHKEQTARRLALEMLRREQGRGATPSRARKAALAAQAHRERSDALHLKLVELTKKAAEEGREARREAEGRRGAERREAGERARRQILEAEMKRPRDDTPKLAEIRARAMAALIGMPVSELTPDRYRAAAGKARGKMTRYEATGQFRKAAAALEQSIYNYEMHRIALKLKAEHIRHGKYLAKLGRGGRFSTLGKVGQDWQDQVLRVLVGFNLSRALLPPRFAALAPIGQWAQETNATREARGEHRLLAVAPSLDARGFTNRPFDRLSIEEMRDVRDSLQSIYEVARTEDAMVRRGVKEALSDRVDRVVSSIRGSKPKRQDADRQSSSSTRWERARGAVAAFYMQHIKAPQLAREMDDFEDGGVVWESLIRPLNEAADTEVTRMVQEIERLQAVFALLPEWGSGNFHKLQDVEGVRQQLSHEDRLGIALLWGNEFGRERLVGHTDSNGVYQESRLGLTQGEVHAVLRTLTESDVQFLNAMFAYYEAFKPEIADKQRRVTGVPPRWVEPIEYEVPGVGTVTGGYHPLKYRPDGGRELTPDQEIAIMTRGQPTAAMTRQGHLIDRVSTTDKRVRLDVLAVAADHTRQVVHDLTHHEALIDVSRVLGAKSVRHAIEEHYGPEAGRQLHAMVGDVARGSIGSANNFEKLMTALRVNTSTAVLAFRPTTAVVNLSGLTQSMVRVGPGRVLKAALQFFGSPHMAKHTMEWVREQSSFMTTREETHHQQVAELRQQASGERGVMQAWKEAGWWMIAKTQAMVDTPTWMAAYAKATEGGAAHADAVAQADQAVRDSQGSAHLVDLSTMQRGGGLQKMWTMFYFYLSTTLNQTSEATQKFLRSEKSAGDAVKLFGRFTMLYVMPALFTVAARQALRGSEDDERDLLKEAMFEASSMGLGTFVGARELTGLISGFQYRGPTALRAVTDIDRLWNEVADLEVDEGLIKAMLNVGGDFTGLPSVQAGAVVDAFTRYSEDAALGAAFRTAVMGRPYQPR